MREKKVRCCKCDSKMELKKDVIKLFKYKEQSVQVPGIAAYCCPKCGNLMFDWIESMRIMEYVHNAVDGVNEER